MCDVRLTEFRFTCAKRLALIHGVCSWQAQGPIFVLVETPKPREARINHLMLIQLIRCIRFFFLLRGLIWRAQTSHMEALLGAGLHMHSKPQIVLLHPTLHLRSETFLERTSRGYCCRTRWREHAGFKLRPTFVQRTQHTVHSPLLDRTCLTKYAQRDGLVMAHSCCKVTSNHNGWAKAHPRTVVSRSRRIA